MRINDEFIERLKEQRNLQSCVTNSAILARSIQQLQQGNEAAWKYAYSWRNIASRLRHTAAPWHVAMLTNLGYRYYAHRLHKFYTCDWMLNPAWPVLGSENPAALPKTIEPERKTVELEQTL